MIYRRLKDILLPLLRPDIAGSSSARVALQRILMLRTLVTCFTVAGALIFNASSSVVIPTALTLGLLSAVILSLALGIWRLRQPWLISGHELFAHLLTDVGFLLIILLYTGGASNPLISYLLVLLAIGATLLSQAYTVLFAVLAIGIYTLFLIAQLQSGNGMGHPPEHGMHPEQNFQLHLVGMWVTFVVSAVLITAFVTRMAAAIRSRELALARGRENEMRNEQLVAIGTLAAGTAHALGTPLSTMAVLLAELDAETDETLRDKSIKADISLLRQQVTRCKDSLNQLTRFYHNTERGESPALTLAQFSADIRDYIVNIHPGAKIDFLVTEASEDALIFSDLSLKHALINIIENALKAATQQVKVVMHCDHAAARLEISVQDDGPGIPAQVMEKLGEPFISTRSDSMGLGIFLANAAIQRLGGQIEMFNLSSGGAMSVLRLPIGAPPPAGAVTR